MRKCKLLVWLWCYVLRHACACRFSRARGRVLLPTRRWRVALGRWPPHLSDSCALLTAWSSGPLCESLGVSPLAELILRSTSRTGPADQAFREQGGAPRRTYHRLLGACLVVSSTSVCTMAAPVKFDAVKFVLDCASEVMVGSDWWKLARSASS